MVVAYAETNEAKARPVSHVHLNCATGGRCERQLAQGSAAKDTAHGWRTLVVFCAKAQSKLCVVATNVVPHTADVGE